MKSLKKQHLAALVKNLRVLENIANAMLRKSLAQRNVNAQIARIHLEAFRIIIRIVIIIIYYAIMEIQNLGQLKKLKKVIKDLLLKCCYLIRKIEGFLFLN